MGKTSNKKVILGIMIAAVFILGILTIDFASANHPQNAGYRFTQFLEDLASHFPVTSVDIADGTIQLEDLSPNLRVLLGIPDTYVSTLSLLVPTGAGLERFLQPTCNPGDMATGGGYRDDNPTVLSYIQFRPNPETQDSIPTSWIVSVKRNPGFDNNPVTFRAYVICIDFTP